MTVTINGSTGIVGATWTTAGRPSSPAVGQRGFNTTTNGAEIYNGEQWNPMSNGFSASGGTITRIGGYTIHTFLSSGTFTPDFAGEVEYLIVAGGGGGSGYGGGGGAGGYRTSTNFAVAAAGLTVTIGAGGAGGSYNGAVAASGSNSVFSTITSLGGGGASSAAHTGAVGGSGGGGNAGHSTAGGAGTAGQGYAGGTAVGSTNYRGPGGGGASEVGVNGTSTAGAGGAGKYSNFSGSILAYAGGGGGTGDAGIGGAGGAGGGGRGFGTDGAGAAGTANTGGGGGAGGASYDSTGQAGGSGIVIIRYPTAGSIILPTVGTAGTVASVNMLQTRTQDSYTAATTGDGTVITPLNITFTPKQAGNKVILEFTVNGECSHDMVFLVSRNGTFLADATDGSNNRWAGTTAMAYDVDNTSTLGNMSIRILDLNTLAVESTYKVQVRSSSGTATTFYLNRSINSAGGDGYETTLSTVTATEIWA